MFGSIRKQVDETISHQQQSGLLSFHCLGNGKITGGYPPCPLCHPQQIKNLLFVHSK